MKSLRLVLGFLMLGLMSANALAAGSAEVDPGHPRRGYRYKVRYHDFDRGFYSHYGYYERECYYSRDYRGTYRTCYEFEPHSYVYVEERHMSNGYTRVAVYESEHASRPYAVYYIYNGQVHRRHYYYHRHYHDHYWDHPHYYHSHSTVWVSLDFDNGFDNLIVGTYAAVVGLDMLVNGDNDFERVVGAGLTVGGSLLKKRGYDLNARERSALQNSILEEQKKEQAGGNDLR